MSSLVYSEEQRMLAASVRKFVAERCSLERFRRYRDASDRVGHDPAVYAEMAELGYVGLSVSEVFGGQGLTFFEDCIVLREAGRRLAPEPLHTALVGAAAIQSGANDGIKAQYLPPIVRGERLVVLADQEAAARHPALPRKTRAVRERAGYVVTGQKIQVPDANVARAFLVSALTENGLGLFLIESGSGGVRIEPQQLIDHRGAGLVTFDGVHVGEESIVALGPGAERAMTETLNRAAIGISAEMLGAAEQAFEDTIDYLKTRKQFGVAIGSFQALQHRAARMYMDLELAQSLLLAAARSVGDDAVSERGRLASMAKARMSELFVAVSKEAIQLHGGIGVTDEHHIGFYLKRAQVASVQFGDATFHRSRLATLSGF